MIADAVADTHTTTTGKRVRVGCDAKDHQSAHFLSVSVHSHAYDTPRAGSVLTVSLASPLPLELYTDSTFSALVCSHTSQCRLHIARIASADPPNDV
jgi:hypothetical protein